MEIKVLSEDERSLSFILSGETVSMANSLRRALIGEVPTLAIETVEFIDNTSSLYDEMLAHRLSFVPITTDLRLFNFRDQCVCEDGCPSCQLELSLKKKGPGAVYSQDLKSSNKKLPPVSGILLAKLGKGQNLEVNARASLGKGKTNSKWQAAVVGYKYHPLIEITKECTNCGDCVSACPRQVFELKKDKLKITDEKKCILCQACVEACTAQAIRVRGDENRFIYEIESTGSLKPREILREACKALIDKAENLSAKLMT